MTKIAIAPNLALPLDIVTQTVGLLAKRRAGKSYTARKLAEQLFRGGQQIVIVDPKGDWYGIRSAADGRQPGLPIVILGGEHGDVPLERDSGEVVAKLVVEERVSILLDLSLFRKHEVATFMTAFLEQLYRLKARDAFRTPLMLLIDEADAIAPQKPMKGEERMLGAAEDIVRRGGQRGIGCTMITQRAAVINKNLLTQIQVLVALRTIAPQDLAALDAWIDVHGTPEERKELMASLPALPVGEAWFWSPGWPTTTGIFQRVKVAPIETFDSGATPRPGEKRREPKNLADVDLEALRRQMSATIEKAKADDPRELRKRIVELERKLTAAASKPAPEPRVERVEVPALSDEEIDRVLEASREIAGVALKLETLVLSLRKGVAPTTSRSQLVRQLQTAPVKREPLVARVSRAISANGSLGKGERAILTVLAQYAHGKTRRALGTLAGYASKGGSFGTYISRLRTKGYIEGSDPIRITQEGVKALGEFEPLPMGEELQSYWLSRLGKGERAILEVLLEAWPNEISREELGRAAGYEASGGSFGTYLSRLRTKELIDSDQLKASDAFFEGGS